MATNITEVRLLSVPLENDYKHTLVFFNGKEEQERYFKSKAKWEMSECTYQRKENIIRFSAHYDTIQDCNYVMYKNRGKWYYAFITKMEYINEELTHIYIETDVMQTWYNDYTVNPSFVEREHCSDDTIGANTVPELLETGEYITYAHTEDEMLKDYVYILQTSEPPDSKKQWFTNYGGVYGTGYAYVFSNIEALYKMIADTYAEKPDAIIGCYIVPTGIIDWDGNAVWSGVRSDGSYVYGQDAPTTHYLKVTDNKTLGTYTKIRNNKLLTFPYRYMLLSNNAGSSNVIHYEDFYEVVGNTLQFKVTGVPCVGGSVKCVPNNYKGLNYNEEEGIMLGKFPVTSWCNDIFTAWMTQNALNLGVGIGGSALSLVGGIGMMYTGAGALAGGGMIASGIQGIASSVGQIYEHSFTPNSAQGNTNGGDYLTCEKKNTFFVYQMGIKKEYARIIDDYFTMYGYKTNRVKVPNTWHRTNFWYTKTINVDIACNEGVGIPNNDMNKIKEVYNNGVTFWQDPDNVGNYLVTNDTGLG